jgi:predicted DNA-binding protein
MAIIRGKEMSVIKTECPPELKNQFKELAKTKGETEASLVRKALMNYMDETRRTVTLSVRKLT